MLLEFPKKASQKSVLSVLKKTDLPRVIEKELLKM